MFMKGIRKEIGARRNLKFRLVIESLLIGVLTGIIISVFRKANVFIV